MLRTFSLFALIVSGLVLVQAQDADKAANFVPVDEWNAERVEAMIQAKAEAEERGRTPEEVRAEVDYLFHLYQKHVRDGNCGAIINLYDPEITLVSYNGDFMKGLEAIQFTLAALEGIGSLNVTTLAMTPLGKEANFVFQYVHVTSNDQQGNLVYSGPSFLIWRRTKDGLKIFREIYDESAMTM